MNFINGEWRSGGGDMFASHDPASGDAIWSGEAAAPDDVAAALGAARSVSAAWARTPLDARLGVVRAFKDQLEAQKPALAEMISRETGKALWESEGEAGAMIGKIGISIKAYDERTGVTETETAFGSAVLRHKPHGVMAVFGPYNFPGHLPNGHIVPALIAGDTVVFKPSELTPAVGEFMVNAWDAAGAPPGVVNLVQGARETGAALADGDIDGLLFTGSVDTGVMFHRKFAGRPDIILALEMGGNNPLVVWNAADAEAAAIVALQSAFITTGQRCSCARRMAVEAGAKGDAIVEALIALAARARIGAWNSEPEPFMGPLVSAAAAQQTLDGQAVYAGMGGRVLLEAKRLDAGAAFVSPGIVDMTDATDVQDAEIFGPLLQVYRTASFDDAIARANATKFGLSAGLVSDDAALWERFAAEIRAGIVNWNRPTTGAASSMPFGGPGFSGNHRASAYYAADYCAYPMASQIAPKLESIATRGLA